MKVNRSLESMYFIHQFQKATTIFVLEVEDSTIRNAISLGLSLRSPKFKVKIMTRISSVI